MEVGVGSRVLLDGLKARPELNGALATVISQNHATGRWNVLVDDMREELALKLEALTLDETYRGIIVGTHVRIAGLTKRPELNGKLGTVQSFHGERCSVYVEAIRETVALKRDVLAIAEEASNAAKEACSERKVRVECNGVILKLTLTAKQMEKPFAEAILRPFLKAYSKKKGLEKEIDVKEVAQVTVDSDGQTQLEVLHDIYIYSAAQERSTCLAHAPAALHTLLLHTSQPKSRSRSVSRS